MSEYFKDGEEFGKTILEMFNKVLTDEKAKARFRELNTILSYEYTDPDVKVWVDLREGRTDGGLGGSPGKVGIRIKTSADNGHKLWSNKMNPISAIGLQKLKVEGPMGKLLKLQPMLKQFAIAYNEALNEMGRDDIVL